MNKGSISGNLDLTTPKISQHLPRRAYSQSKALHIQQQSRTALFDDTAVVNDSSTRLLDTSGMLEQQEIQLLLVQNQIPQERPDLGTIPLGLDFEQCCESSRSVQGQLGFREVANVLLLGLVHPPVIFHDVLALMIDNEKKR